MFDDEKQCAGCHECKPLTMFSPFAQGVKGRHPHCKACRNERARMRLQTGRRKDRPKPGRMGETNPGAWKYPRDDRPAYERILDRALRQMVVA